MPRRTKRIACILVVAATSLSLSGCFVEDWYNKLFGGGQTVPAQQRKPQVSVVEIQPRNQLIVSTLQGRTSPYLVAEVRPQVSGILLKRLFEEGSDVKEGEPLYQIDDSVYKAAVESAAAELERAEAVKYQSQLTADRYAHLVKTLSVSKQQNDDAQAALKQAIASVAAAKAQLLSAQINLDYTTVRSPITGKAGRSLVTPGVLLTGYQANNMVVIQTLDPIYVDVNQSSNDLLRMKREVAEGRLELTEGVIPVDLVLEDGTKYAHKGKLTLSEVSVDQGTGTITLRAEFPNPDGVLLPGMYVKAELPEGVRQEAIFTPEKSVMRLSSGKPYVYTVENGVVVQKLIETERTVGEDWLVTSGLNPGDKVVIEGLQRIRAEMPVDIVPTIAEQEAAAAKEKKSEEQK